MTAFARAHKQDRTRKCAQCGPDVREVGGSQARVAQRGIVLPGPLIVWQLSGIPAQAVDQAGRIAPAAETCRVLDKFRVGRKRLRTASRTGAHARTPGW